MCIYTYIRRVLPSIPDICRSATKSALPADMLCHKADWRRELNFHKLYKTPIGNATKACVQGSYREAKEEPNVFFGGFDPLKCCIIKNKKTKENK